MRALANQRDGMEFIQEPRIGGNPKTALQRSCALLVLEESGPPLLLPRQLTPSIQVGSRVRYAGSTWVVAEIAQFPHGPMIGIYDEPPSGHIDYLHPESVTLAV